MSAITAKASRKMKKYAVLTREPRCFLGSFDFSWEQRKLGDVVKEITRNDPESEAPIMMITANNGFIEQSERYAFNNAGESLKKYILLKKGELAYNHGASKLRPYGSCFALTTAENARIPFVYHCFSAENQNAEFMSIELNGAEIENQLRKIVSSGARMDGLLNISFDEYTSVSVILPGTEEQDRIADFFRHLDNLITLHQRKCVFLFGFFQAFISMIFTASTFSWEQRKVQDVADRFDNLRIPVAANLRVHGTTPYYGANGIQDYVEGFTHDGEFVLVAEDGANDLKNYPVKCVNGRIWVNNHAHILQGKAGIADNSFLAFAISQSDIESLLVGGSRAKLNAETLMSIEFKLPCLQEQYRIGEYLTQLDHLITLHQRKGKAAVSGCFLNCSSLEKSSAQSRTLELFGQTSNQEIKYIIDGLSILGGKLRNFCVKLIILLSYTRINDIAKYHISRNTECVHNIN